MEQEGNKSFFSFLAEPLWKFGWLLTIGLHWTNIREFAITLPGTALDKILFYALIAVVQYFTWPIGLGIFLASLR